MIDQNVKSSFVQEKDRRVFAAIAYRVKSLYFGVYDIFLITLLALSGR
jgi:hypothetical protein